MRLEFSVNQRSDRMPESIAEVCCSTGSLDRALSVVPSIVPPRFMAAIRRLLRPWPDGRYAEAYGRSGGILNLLTPPWGEEQDEAWKAMLAERITEDVEALRALGQRWNTTPHPFFAGLTPAQVMVGGGNLERDLAEEFLAQLMDRFDGHPFESEGEALIQTLAFLRGWQRQPRLGGRTPFDIIVAERDDLLARRARALSARTLPRTPQEQ